MEQEEAFQQLISYIKSNDFKSAEELLKMQKDPESLIENENSIKQPLYQVAKRGLLSFLKLFLSYGADPFTRHEKTGMASIHVAVMKSHMNIIKSLIESDSDLVDLETDTSGNDILCTPLHLAASLNSPHSVEIIHYLLQKGADINRFDVKNRTPLWRAVRAVQYSNVKVLLESKSNPDIADESGITPLHLAASQAQHHLVILLMNHKADPNIQDNMGDMALHHCAQIQIQRLIYNFNLSLRFPHLETFFYMLVYGNANPNIQNKEGDCPLDIIDAPLADLFDYYYKYKLNLSKHSLTFTSLIEQTPEQIASIMGSDPSITPTFSSIFNTAKEYLLDKLSDAPCTFVNTRLIPNKRKFKSRLSSGEIPQGVNQIEGVLKCPVTGQTGIIPKGHAQYIEKLKEGTPIKVPEIKSAKCPFSPNYEGEDQAGTCAQQ